MPFSRAAGSLVETTVAFVALRRGVGPERGSASRSCGGSGAGACAGSHARGSSPAALLVLAGVGGILTVAVLGLAFVGAGLALTCAPAARILLIVAALAGFVTAMPLWIPAGVVIGAAAILLGQSGERHPSGEHSRRNLLPTTGVDTRTPR